MALEFYPSFIQNTAETDAEAETETENDDAAVLVNYYTYNYIVLLKDRGVI